MSFHFPMLLWLLAALPVWAGLLALWGAVRPNPSRGPPKAARIREGALSGGRVRFDRHPRQAPPWRLWIALSLAILAMAGPRWGEAPGDAAAPPSGQVLIALDLSASMLAGDVAPSRLDQARRLATRLLQERPGLEVGLLAFAGDAHLLAPVSGDHALTRAYLTTLAPRHMPRPGSDFAAMLDLAAASLPQTSAPRLVLVLSDGEAAPEPWRPALARLAAQGLSVVAVGFGSPGGQALADEAGQPVRDQSGAVVVSRLDEAALREMAEATGGRYLAPAQHDQWLAALDQALRQAAAESGPSGEEGPAPAERYGLFAAAALAFLVWSMALDLPVRPRLRRPSRRWAASLVGLALVGAATAPHMSDAQPILTEADLQEEEDPLRRMLTLAAEIAHKPKLTAGDYLRVAEVAIRYGEIHRGHGHPIEEGLLRDGLLAVAAGRALDPDLADWAGADAKLRRLLQPPPPVPLEDPGPADPANEPMDAQGQQPIAGEDARQGGDEPAPDEAEPPTAGEQGLQNLGGSQQDEFDPEAWRNPALVQPLDILRRLKAADSPAELFARRHAGAAPPAGGQTW